MKNKIRKFFGVILIGLILFLFPCCLQDNQETTNLTEEDFRLDYTISATDVWKGEEIVGNISFKKPNVLLWPSYRGEFLKWRLYNEKTSILSSTDTEEKHGQIPATYTELNLRIELDTVTIEPGSYYFYAYTEFEYKGKSFELKTEEVKITIGWEEPSEGLEFDLTTDGYSYKVSGIGSCKDANLVIPSVVENKRVVGIRQYAFENCKTIESVKIHKGINYIEKSAFWGCSNLKKITTPEDILIKERAFENCIALKDIHLGNENIIGENVFFNTAYYNDEQNWERSLLYIGENLVARKDVVERDVVIKEGTTRITEFLFFDCDSIESVWIPSTVLDVGYLSFTGCSNLKNIEVDENNPNYFSIDGNLYENFTIYGILEDFSDYGSSYVGNGTKLSQYAIGKTQTQLILPDGLDSIREFAFYGAKNLTNVDIPDSVKEIGQNAFEKCANLESVKLPNGLKRIRKYMFFDCWNLISIDIPDSVEEIESDVFKVCFSLQEVMIGKNVYVIDANTFKDCESLATIKVSEEHRYYSSADGVLYDKYKRTLVYYPRGKSDETFIIPDSVTHIRESAFSKNRFLKTITISDNVKTLSAQAFSDCRRLTSVIFETVRDWKVSIWVDGKKTERVISKEELKDSLKMAEYLTNTYSSYQWTPI